nr:hypothetical protein [Pseudomonas insulae]
MLGWTAESLAATPLQLAQLHACRATSSLLMYRFEGFQDVHAGRLEQDLAALAAALQANPQSSDALRQQQQALTELLRAGSRFGHHEDDLPWNYATELSEALRVFLSSAHQLDNNQAAPIEVEAEYLAVQYLYRAYVGLFEISREQQQLTYVGQDERQLLPSIDGQLQRLAGKHATAVQARWPFLRNALADMNSASGGTVTLSHRPFAPLIVDRQVRQFSSQLLAAD